MKQLTLEEFAWRCLWLECGRLATQDWQCGTIYLLKQVRALKRRATEEKLWTGPYGKIRMGRNGPELVR
jgi:hypothetical protein